MDEPATIATGYLYIIAYDLFLQLVASHNALLQIVQYQDMPCDIFTDDDFNRKVTINVR